jgi:hypothetical protein
MLSEIAGWRARREAIDARCTNLELRHIRSGRRVKPGWVVRRSLVPSTARRERGKKCNRRNRAAHDKRRQSDAASHAIGTGHREGRAIRRRKEERRGAEKSSWLLGARVHSRWLRNRQNIRLPDRTSKPACPRAYGHALPKVSLGARVAASRGEPFEVTSNVG